MELRPGSDGALVQERVAAQQRPKAAAAPEVAAVRIRADHDAALFFRRTSQRCSAATSEVVAVEFRAGRDGALA